MKSMPLVVVLLLAGVAWVPGAGSAAVPATGEAPAAGPMRPASSDAPSRTTLDAATLPPHWHRVAVADGQLHAVDVHGIRDRSAENNRLMTSASFHPAGGDADFIVRDQEYDCTRPRRQRPLESTTYRVSDETATAIAHETAPGAWLTADAGSLDAVRWHWACYGDEEIDALPAGASFVQLLARHRDALGKSTAR